jgi:hypothetical protein
VRRKEKRRWGRWWNSGKAVKGMWHTQQKPPDETRLTHLSAEYIKYSVKYHLKSPFSCSDRTCACLLFCMYSFQDLLWR